MSADRAERSSNDSLRMDVVSTCRLIKEEKRIFGSPLPSLVAAPTIEVPNFKDGFTLDTLIKFCQDMLNRYRRIPFFRFRIFFIAFLLASFFILPKFMSGMIFGVYLSMILFLFVCVSDSIPEPTKAPPPICDKVLDEMSAEAIKEESRATFTKTVLVRLDGNMLRISRPERAMLKHTFHTDPTLTEPEPRMLTQSIYDLTNASVNSDLDVWLEEDGLAGNTPFVFD
uniref:Uncharacterized protein n=1 Tax=Ditylenchus dipsaci TaxID=166011 RepID=A0A915ERB7_9BILA